MIPRETAFSYPVRRSTGGALSFFLPLEIRTLTDVHQPLAVIACVRLIGCSFSFNSAFLFRTLTFSFSRSFSFRIVLLFYALNICFHATETFRCLTELRRFSKFLYYFFIKLQDFLSCINNWGKIVFLFFKHQSINSFDLFAIRVCNKKIAQISLAVRKITRRKIAISTMLVE